LDERIGLAIQAWADLGHVDQRVPRHGFYKFHAFLWR
jgi:hypothetical protein